NATVNPGNLPTEVYFQWVKGFLNHGYSASKTIPATNGVVTVSIDLPFPLPIASPAAGQFFAYAQNSAGFVSGDASDFVLAPFTDSATGITTNSASLNGFAYAANQPNEVFFEWGTTTNYGNFSSTNTLPAMTSLTNVNTILGGLSAGAAYHYRLVSVENGVAAYG